MTSVVTYASQARSFARYVAGLRGFLRTRVTTAECVEQIGRRLADRDRSFTAVVRRAIFDNPDTPYRPLLAHAGIELGDVEKLVADHGVEGTLDVLHDAGVFVRLDEFKGRVPIERPGLSYEVAAHQFDNPLLDPVYRATTGGSSGSPRAVQLDFTSIAHGVAYTGLLFDVYGLADRAHALWRPVPPGSAGLNNLLAFNKLGVAVERWFTQTWPAGGIAGAAERAVLRYSAFAARRWGAGLGRVEQVRLDDAERVARWLAERVLAGNPPVLSAPASSAVRVARAAEAAGVDIAGTLMRVGGEPFTDAKAAALAEVGCAYALNYSMAEVGRLGVGCADPASVDDVHLMADHVGVIQRRAATATEGAPVDGLWVTTLNEACRKVMLNVEVGDHAVLTRRRCGCPAGALGLDIHLHSIRSHEKLTSEGMNFLGTDVIDLVETVLPRRFGGGVGDYQLVEQEQDGLPKISVLVHPRIGAVDEGAVLDEVLGSLRAGASFRGMMTSVLEDGRTVRVVRREPYTTPSAKTPPLHIVRP